MHDLGGHALSPCGRFQSPSELCGVGNPPPQHVMGMMLLKIIMLLFFGVDMSFLARLSQR